MVPLTKGLPLEELDRRLAEEGLHRPDEPDRYFCDFLNCDRVIYRLLQGACYAEVRLISAWYLDGDEKAEIFKESPEDVERYLIYVRPLSKVK